MTLLSRIWCWLKREHSNPRLFTTDTVVGKETWVCRDCLEVWSEYNTTGRPLQGSMDQTLKGTPARR